VYPHLELFDRRAWGLIVYDEVHLLPAPVFQITASLQARRRLGLTATLVREDRREDDVFALGADEDNDGGFVQGALWILSQDLDGTVASQTKISASYGALGCVIDLADLFGVAVAALGDLDGDGRGELAVGASHDDDVGTDQGAVWILFLRDAAATFSGDGINSDAIAPVKVLVGGVMERSTDDRTRARNGRSADADGSHLPDQRQERSLAHRRTAHGEPDLGTLPRRHPRQPRREHRGHRAANGPQRPVAPGALLGRSVLRARWRLL
jgi:hypothetical protein